MSDFKLEQLDHSPARRSRSTPLISEGAQVVRPSSRFSRHASPSPTGMETRPAPQPSRTIANVVATEDKGSGSQLRIVAPSVHQRDETRRGRRPAKLNPQSVGIEVRRSPRLHLQPSMPRRGQYVGSRDEESFEMSEFKNGSPAAGTSVPAPSGSVASRSLVMNQQAGSTDEEANNATSLSEDSSEGNNAIQQDEGPQQQGPMLPAAANDNLERVLARVQSYDDYQRALDCFSGTATFLAYTFNLGFLLLVTPFCVAIDQGSYHLRRYTAHFVGFALVVVALGAYMLKCFLAEFNALNPKMSPEMGFIAGSDFPYLLCVLGQVWCLAVTTKNLQHKFFGRFTTLPNSPGKLLLISQLAPAAVLVVCWSAYSSFGEDVRRRGAEDVIEDSFRSASAMFNFKCRRQTGYCRLINGESFMGIKTWLEVLKLVLELQMLACANVIRMIGVEIRHQYILHLEMTNADIIWLTRLFVAADDLVDGLNRSITAVSITYYTQIFPYLTYSVFQTSQGQWEWVAFNSAFLLLKVGTPMLASSGTRMIAKAAKTILARLNHRDGVTEAIADPIERAERRAYRSGLIHDFKDATEKPITLKCLGFFSIHDKWIVLAVGGVYTASLFLLELRVSKNT